VVFIPVFFAGVIFATAFRDSKNPDIDFGSNVAGIILGGLSEQLSLIIGFKFLLLVALGYYALSWILRPGIPGEITSPGTGVGAHPAFPVVPPADLPVPAEAAVAGGATGIP
jgi:hypothetical protein